MLVVDDLLADVHRGAVQLERALDRLYGAIDAGAVAARGGEQQRVGTLGPCPECRRRSRGPGRRSPQSDECRRGNSTVRSGTLTLDLPPPDPPRLRMPQNHLDRLTSIDASFLHQEGAASHMHIGALLIFEGPPPEFAAYLDHVRGRLHLVPRYRQKLTTPPLETGRPCGSTIRASTSSTTSATPRCPRRARIAAVPAGRADRLPAAGPREAPVGELAGRGAGGGPLRARYSRPTTRSSTASRAWIWRPCCSISSPPAPPVDRSRAVATQA